MMNAYRLLVMLEQVFLQQGGFFLSLSSNVSL